MLDPSLYSLAASALERAINIALKYDPASQARLAQLDNTNIQIQTHNPSAHFSFLINDRAVLVSAVHEAQESDVKISGEFFDFFTLATQKEASLAKLDIEVSGKVGVLEDIKNILTDLDIDWEAPINEIFGNVPGHAIAQAVRQSSAWLNKQTNNLSDSLPALLIDELELLPSETELKQFYKEVDEANALSQRIHARIQRIQSSINQV
ncbi:MAG: SCP2 sterol-binding domain-containing protein [Agarilytica sp.]